MAEQATSDFVGSWELESIEARTEAGEWVPTSFSLGGQPVGLIMYDGRGNMAVQITSIPRSDATPGQSTEVVNGYAAYFGTYEVNAAAATVTHHRRHHINPDLEGVSVVRHFHFSGNRLTLTVAPEKELRLSWVRI